MLADISSSSLSHDHSPRRRVNSGWVDGLGVSASRSSGSELTGVIGRELRIPSTSTNGVCKTSESTRRFKRIARRACFQDFINPFI